MTGPHVAGLDLSLTSTGIAGHGPPTTAKPPKSLTGMDRLGWLLSRVRAALDDLPAIPDLVAVEGYSMGAKGRAITGLAELGGVVRFDLWRSEVRWVDVPPANLKIFATGSGQADKYAVVCAARDRLGYGGTQPDEADAAWLRELGRHLWGAPTVTLPKTHTRALTGVTLHEPKGPPS